PAWLCCHSVYAPRLPLYIPSFPTRRSSDLAADQRAAHPEPLDRILQLLGGEIGIGERDRGEADKAVRRLAADLGDLLVLQFDDLDRKSTRLNSSHQIISYAVFCLKKTNEII